MSLLVLIGLLFLSTENQIFTLVSRYNYFKIMIPFFKMMPQIVFFLR